MGGRSNYHQQHHHHHHQQEDNPQKRLKVGDEQMEEDHKAVEVLQEELLEEYSLGYFSLDGLRCRREDFFVRNGRDLSLACSCSRRTWASSSAPTARSRMWSPTPTRACSCCRASCCPRALAPSASRRPTRRCTRASTRAICSTRATCRPRSPCTGWRAASPRRRR